jgi:cell division protein FtsI (penicillin-binding protein 3)
MRPYVIRRIVPAHNGAVVETRPQRLAAAVTPATAATLRMLLGRVTEAEGTGIRARIPGVAVAGKTGTAQKPVDGSYSDTAYTASFVGFLPAEAPEVGIIVVVDEPQPLHTGGAVAAPVFAAIAEPTMRYLGGRPADGAIAAR